MTDLNVSIPDDLEQFVEAEAAANGYASPGDYVRAVIEAMRRRKDFGEVERTIVDRLNGPAAVELTPEVWADLQSRVKRRLAGSSR